MPLFMDRVWEEGSGLSRILAILLNFRASGVTKMNGRAEQRADDMAKNSHDPNTICTRVGQHDVRPIHQFFSEKRCDVKKS